eukprot:13008950-Alexandrium_andersonii.AAC.1
MHELVWIHMFGVCLAFVQGMRCSDLEQSGLRDLRCAPVPYQPSRKTSCWKCSDMVPDKA